ncbi:Biotin transporter BioY [Pseudovibrio axinellae]|uniref:Biotin transporter n=2 Tax=Pseudovibrio axinellae TaxID=989403 RepID=A0A166A3H2_9HYPH|nr:biotin transporter BioY [Pseudovibrio axinellae]KZL20588.1 Biotin transporter BioY [Pseudovibrio axinellae]SER28508.1 biotin transport system substrate-specific component [Pseudovibrio axinellae]
MSSDRSLVHIAFYAALIAALGLMPKIELGLAGGIPITAQSLGVMLAGMMLGPVRGGLAVGLFLFLVALGLPLLAGGRGGIGVFYGASAGYLAGYLVGAIVVGAIMKAMRNTNVVFGAVVSGVIGGIVVVHALGVPVLAYKAGMSLDQAIMVGSLPFIPGDLIKVVLATLVAHTIARGLPSAILSRA